MTPMLSIRPSKDLRTHYAQVAALTREGPVAITVNGRQDTVLVSHEDYMAQCRHLDEMFRSCTGLESVSLVLAAPDLAQDCYREMFRDCSKLASVPQGMLPSTNLATSCYRQMFSNCKIPVAPDLPATTLKQECYHTMFSGTPITAAPDLNAATLVKDCYNQMFSGCSQLANVKCLATDISAATCTDAWLKGVKSTGTFTKALSMTSWTTGQNGIPSGWTVENYPAE